MLVELSVRDLGVIHDLRLTLGEGMTAFTGETGAGKTLLVEAIELLTGGRADPLLVRPGAAEAVVEGRFLTGDDELILSRAVPANGRSRAYVDGRMAQSGTLSERAEELVDLHGQHGHQSLLRPAGQRQALDAFAGIDLALRRQARDRVRAAEAALAGLGGDARARAREMDLLEHQLTEIDRAGLSDPAEEAALAAEEELLARAVEHRTQAENAYDLLVGEGGAADRVGAAVAATAGRPPFSELHQRLGALAAELGDVASEIRTTAESINEDPERLEELRLRRQLLRDLVRKYGADLGEVIEYAARARDRHTELAGHDATAAQLEAELDRARGEVEAEEGRIRRERAAAAPVLGARVGEHLRSLALASAVLEVEVGPEGAGDTVSFLFSANPGSPPLPLAKVASGGELARAMLATRLVISAGPPVLVFDEVDAGVGGEAALAVGRALAGLAQDHQVLVVTHLAQVAAFADHQVAVRKTVEDGTTRTEVEVLGSDARVVELSRMLAGQPDSSSARLHAEELLELARKRV
ncbi:MAG TPA: DNA repair protein RecN [Acidimicrobiales bacterium]|nr:DNA repair protein RecN [Acidimicrobiales bacterium]